MLISYLSMDVSEINEISANNYPVSYSENTNNIATSDELSPINQDSSYAKDKRSSGVATSLTIFAISGVAILTGSSLLSSLITDPEIKDISITSSTNSVTLNTTIYNPQGLDVLASLFENDSLKEETHLSDKGENAYTYTFNDVDFTKTVKLRISFSNRLDYSKTIYEETINKNVETANSYIGG